MRRFLAILFVAVMLLSYGSGITNAVQAAQQVSNIQLELFEAEKTEALNSEAKAGLNDDEPTRIMVRLVDDSAIKSNTKSSSYASSLIAKQNKAITGLEKKLNKELTDVENYSLLFNGFAFTGIASDIDVINGTEGMIAFAVPEFDLPETTMASSTGIVGATHAWNTDYTGKGQTIAILDTGIRLTHEAFSVMPEECSVTKEELALRVEENAEYLHAGNDVDELYKSEKIPYAYDYQYLDYDPNHTSSDHGTHVAGIAAGNNGVDFKGVAYDAQLFVMQVFSSNGSCAWDVLMSALEDCAYLKVDVVNMSLGSTAGFSTYADESYEQAFELLEKSGVLIAAASGNDTSTAKNNAYNGYQLAMNPDYGVTGSPATYSPCVSVASSNNRTASTGYIYAYGNSMVYNEPQKTDPLFVMLDGTYEYVCCGNGSIEEMTNAHGRIAVVKRGVNTFSEIAKNAEDSGCIAVIVYNNDAGNFSNITVTTQIPFVTLSDVDGAILVNNAVDGVGLLDIRAGDIGTAYDKISDFSSRGTTSDLLIKPEITAPGGAITSSVGFYDDISYSTWNGTSMATPHIAGGLSIIKSYVEDKLPHASREEVVKIATAILMDTATPLKNELITAQGAGIMNLEAAVSTELYITVNGVRPKLELGESDTATWQFGIELNNFSDKELKYNIDENLFIESPFYNEITGSTEVFLLNGTPLDINDLVIISNSSEDVVTVPAGEQRTVTFDVNASQVMEKYSKECPSGLFLEGFISFKSDVEELNVPLLGFMGDWDYASMFDRGFYWQAITGEASYQSNRAIYFNLAAAKNAGDLTGIGFNPYITTGCTQFNCDWGTISPNGDGVLDAFDYVDFALLRNPKTLEVTVETEHGVKVLYQPNPYSFKKDYDTSGGGYSHTKLDIDYDGSAYYDDNEEVSLPALNEGETAYIKLTAMLDHEGFTIEANELAQWVIPVTYDTTAPALFVDNGRIGVYDEHYVAYVVAWKDASCLEQISATPYFNMERGITSFIEGMEDAPESVYVMVGDYAGNTAYYSVNRETGEIISEQNSYLLTYMVNDTVFSQTRYNAGDAVTAITDVPSVEGYRFVGWDIEAPETMPNSNVTIHAVLEQLPEYTVTFVDWDNTVLSTQTVFEGGSAQAPDQPTREDYTFTGWDKEFSCVMEDITVTAVYELVVATVTYTDYDDTVIHEEKVAVGEAATYSEVPTYKDHVFCGWNADLTSVTDNITVKAEYALLGDVNQDGLVNTGDAVYLLKAAAGMIELSQLEMVIGDTTFDGLTNTGDAVRILKFSSGMLDSFTDYATK